MSDYAHWTREELEQVIEQLRADRDRIKAQRELAKVACKQQDGKIAEQCSEIKRLRENANVQQAEIERLRAERDEAREAARHYREMWGHLYVDDKFDVDVWPWLEEEVGDE